MWFYDLGMSPARAQPCARDEIGMQAQTVTCAFDQGNDGVMEKAIQQGGYNDIIREHFAPFTKAVLGNEDHEAAFVAGNDHSADEPTAGK